MEWDNSFNSLYWVHDWDWNDAKVIVFFQFPLLGSFTSMLSLYYTMHLTFNSLYWVLPRLRRFNMSSQFTFQFPLLGSKSMCGWRIYTRWTLSIPSIGFLIAQSKYVLHLAGVFQFPLLGSQMEKDSEEEEPIQNFQFPLLGSYETTYYTN